MAIATGIGGDILVQFANLQWMVSDLRKIAIAGIAGLGTMGADENLQSRLSWQRYCLQNSAPWLKDMKRTQQERSIGDGQSQMGMPNRGRQCDYGVMQKRIDARQLA